MIDEYFGKRHKRRIIDLNIVPILDMLTTVIFFLLLSTSFMEYTKLTLPPSKTTVQSDPVAPPPLQPKFFVVPGLVGTYFQLVWSGGEGGELSENLTETDPEKRRGAVFNLAATLAKEFKKKFPKENSIQLGLGKSIEYQDMISAMDGIREAIADVVLIAPSEAEIRTKATNPDAFPKGKKP